ncbi:AAA family ATPase [Spirillospora sp. NBC_00431]
MERASQIEQLKRIFKKCTQERGTVGTIIGPAASGKSALLDTLVAEASKAGATVLLGNGSASESSLPLGLLGQLFHNAPKRADSTGSITGFWADDSVSSLLVDLQAGGPARARAMERICAVLLRAARDRPLLIAVDDTHEADPLSLRCLVYCARRIRSASVLMILTCAEHSQLGRSEPFIEILRLPHCYQIKVAPLSESGVAAFLAKNRPDTATDRDPTAWHVVSGGNPLLLQALLEDQQNPGQEAPERPEAPIVGQAFRTALVSCLHGSDPALLEAARALAILDGHQSPELVVELTGREKASVADSLHALEAAGLLHEGRLRHPQARVAVLADLAPDEKARLHRRAGRTLYDSGATPDVIAGHLVAAGQPSEPWMLPVLLEAANHALNDDHVELAVECLKLADLLSGDTTQRSAIKVLLAVAERRVDPRRSLRHLPDLVERICEGPVDEPYLTLAIRLLLWHGRPDDVVTVLKSVDRAADAPRAQDLPHAPGQWLKIVCPEILLSEVPRMGPAANSTRDPRPVIMPAERAALAMDAVLSGQDGEEGAIEAEQVLESARLDDTTIEPIVTALLTLVYCDRLDTATSWCDHLLDKVMARKVAGWQAQLAAVRAEIALRHGDLGGATVHLRTALQLMPPQAWGIALGLPLSTLIQVSSAAGRFDETESALSLPTPDVMLKSRYGLGYLYARGQHHLAVDRPRAAIQDFLTCGQLMVAWDMDVPGFAPWRAGAAAASLRLNDHDRARRLLHAQMKRPGADGGRAKGMALRLLAALPTAKNRLALLRDSVDVLEDCGDRLELARSLADLGHAHSVLSELNRARPILRLARRLAQSCQAQPLLETLTTNAHPVTIYEEADLSDIEEVESLSNAERRVAELATRGDSNREIARRLCITVSTVEQHLTRIYRKLDVAGRDELPTKLQVAFHWPASQDRQKALQGALGAR